MRMKSYDIAVIPGDGTGPEVTREALKVCEAAAKQFRFRLNWQHYDFGGERYLKTGEVLPDSAVSEFRKFKAMFLGAVGHAAAAGAAVDPVRDPPHAGVRLDARSVGAAYREADRALSARRRG